MNNSHPVLPVQQIDPRYIRIGVVVSVSQHSLRLETADGQYLASGLTHLDWPIDHGAGGPEYVFKRVEARVGSLFTLVRQPGYSNLYRRLVPGVEEVAT